VDPVKKGLRQVEPDQAVAGTQTMQEVVSGSLGSRRFPMLLLSGFAALALALAAVGIAGVVGYSVVQRTQEIGIRMALGAESKDALRPLQSMLYGIESTDPLMLMGVSLVLTAVAAATSYLPVRRASRVDPVVALEANRARVDSQLPRTGQ
jgi:ABC-type antimicrobial peptide transport system permease subunit